MLIDRLEGSRLLCRQLSLEAAKFVIQWLLDNPLDLYIMNTSAAS